LSKQPRVSACESSRDPSAVSIPRIRLVSEADAEQTSRALDQALGEIGFVGVTDSGMPSSLLDDTFAQTKAFFRRSEADKTQFGYRSAGENFGYQSVGQEHLDPAKPADIKQTFTMRNIERFAANDARWPSQAFYDCMRQFHAAAIAIAARLETHLADTLKVAPDYFSTCHSGENVSLRLLHYPAVEPSKLSAGQLGAGEHTDYGLLTLLFQHEIGGLEVLSKNNQWCSVAYEPNLIVVNSGDLLERWTNGRYCSTRHRVPPQTEGQERFSIALFIDPDSNTDVRPLASCVSAAHPARYAATTAGEHIQSKINASHKTRFGA